MNTRMWLAIAFTAALAASSALAAPGGGGGGSGSAGSNAKGMGAQQSQEKPRTEAEERRREMKNAPDKGERNMSREEVNERTRSMEEGGPGKGADTSKEMQQRNEERKQIQQEYKEGRKSGEVEPAKKKPWWRFWGEEEAS